MMTAIILTVAIGLIMWLIAIIITQAMLPCDKCPLRKKCKQLERDGHPNICTQKMLNLNNHSYGYTE